MLPYCTEAIRRICRLVGISVQSEIRGDCLFIFLPLYNLFNPLALWALPLYSLTEIPRNTTGHGREEGNTHKEPRSKKMFEEHFSPLPLLIVDEIGGVPAGRGG